MFDFVQSADTPRAAAEVLREVKIVGWAARLQHESRVRAVGVDAFFPVGRVDSISEDVGDEAFSPFEEENLCYLLDREGRFENHLHVTQRRLEVLSWASTALGRARPDTIFFSDVPHNVFSYALYLLAKRHGVRTLFFRLGPAPHLFSFGEDIDSGVQPTLLDGRARRAGSPPTVESREYLQRLRRSYGAAEPTYMKRQRAQKRPLNRLFKLLSNTKEIFDGTSLRKGRAALLRLSLENSYRARETTPSLDVPYIAIFLHLQPERSSMPEGGRYAQQLRIVHALAHARPHGWSVYVREHPSTFRAGPKLVRGVWMYDALERLPGVTLVPTTLDPFVMIDGAQAVATITGTVGFEAVARGKPALVFGAAPYAGGEGVYRISKAPDCVSALAELRQGVVVGKNAAEDLLADFEHSPRTLHIKGGVSDPAAFWRTGRAHVDTLRLMIAHAQDCLQ